MSSQIPPEETSLEKLANIPLSELVEPQDLGMPPIEPQDLELPYEYIEDLMQRGVIDEDRSIIDNDTKFLGGPEREPSPFEQTTTEPEVPLRDDTIDFGR